MRSLAGRRHPVVLFEEAHSFLHLAPPHGCAERPIHQCRLAPHTEAFASLIFARLTRRRQTEFALRAETPVTVAGEGLLHDAHGRPCGSDALRTDRPCDCWRWGIRPSFGRRLFAAESASLRGRTRWRRSARVSHISITENVISQVSAAISSRSLCAADRARRRHGSIIIISICLGRKARFGTRRLGFLAQLRTASPMLSCTFGCMRLPWTKAVVGDLVALQAGDVDAWIKLAVDNKSSWKQLVKPVLTHIGSPALGPAQMVRCPDCHKSFLVKGLGAHRALVHNVFRVARTVVDRSGICPVCGLFFHTRQRVVHHIEHSCESCKAAVQAGLVQTLPEALMNELDTEDAKERREARKQGVSYLALRGEEWAGGFSLAGKASYLCDPCWSWHRGASRFLPPWGNVAERLRSWYLPELDLLWVQLWYFWCCSASVL